MQIRQLLQTARHWKLSFSRRNQEQEHSQYTRRYKSCVLLDVFEATLLSMPRNGAINTASNMDYDHYCTTGPYQLSFHLPAG